MMSGVKGKSGRKPKNGVRTSVHLNPQVYETLKLRGDMSAQIENMVQATMKHWDPEIKDDFRRHWSAVSELGRYELDDMETAIHARRLELAADELRQYGYKCLTSANGVYFRYVLVYDPNGSAPAVWADVADCQRLRDTVRNLPPQAAFERWAPKVEPLPKMPYTQDQAVRDMQIARAGLKAQYEAGEISADDLRLGYEATRDYKDLAE